ncbi:uncharacterized protein LOC119089931 [Pollicipes pollicipes]|uniref:uncharacterized protein LOC119089931 n=1 Tax=Pollicipes pollicipes TaxID=41117 RepID=UPI0018850AEB|nr:uncharacterized protein LOC119089931 [Pollicipes pollicipes]
MTRRICCGLLVYSLVWRDQDLGPSRLLVQRILASGYPHQGGYKLELLDANEKVKMTLTTDADEKGYNALDTTAQTQRVTMPEGVECLDCSIRLMRQAREFGDKYQFWSCADVDIIGNDYREDCNGHGRASFGRCRCDRRSYGERCQFSNECEQDSHCGTYGKCIDLAATTYPKKQCFCRLGFFGKDCAQRNPAGMRKKITNFGLYQKREMSPEYTLYWRVLPEVSEIEMVMQVRGVSYAAVGWRPGSLDASCKRFPQRARAQQ